MVTSRVEVVHRYVAWLARHSWAVLLGGLVVLALSVDLVAFHLPLFADFSYLLPQDAPAVRDLRRLEARVKATDTVLVVVRAPTAEPREAATARHGRQARARLPARSSRASTMTTPSSAAFLRAHRELFVAARRSRARARRARARAIHDAKLAANPLYVDLDDHPEADATERSQRPRRAAAETPRRRGQARSTEQRVSADGTIAMVEIRIAFPAPTSVAANSCSRALDASRANVVAAHPGVEIGFTGGIVTALAEHRALAQRHGGVEHRHRRAGRARARAVLPQRDVLAVLLVMHARSSPRPRFGAAAFTVGHLNAATAFLGAIIAGNGVNYGILLIARFLEERARQHATSSDALAIAIARHAAPDRGRLARRVDRVRLARRDQLQGLRRLRGDRRDRHAAVLGRERSCCCRPR